MTSPPSLRARSRIPLGSYRGPCRRTYTRGASVPEVHSPHDPCTPIARAAVNSLRLKLLDRSLRNPLLNFKHSARSRRFVRVIDDSLDRIFARLGDDGSFQFVPLPAVDSIPVDEKTPNFLSTLDRARID